MESTTEFTIDAKSVTTKSDGKVKAILTTPSGAKLDTLVTPNSDGTYTCLYTPFEQGISFTIFNRIYNNSIMP